jgi:hypothetical protein
MTQTMAEESLTRWVLLPGSPRSRGRRVSHATAWQCRLTAPCGGRGWASDARRRRRGTHGVGEPSEVWDFLYHSTCIVSRQAWPLARACPGRPWPPMVRRAHSIAVPCPCGMQIAGRGSYLSHGHGRRARLGWHASGTISLNLDAQFLAVCRRSQMRSMGMRKPRKGLRLCKRCGLQREESHHASARFYALQIAIN